MWGYLLKGFRFIVVLGVLALNAAQVSACPGDFDGNGHVDIADFLALAGAFGTRSGDAKYNAGMDMDGSGAIDILDFLAFARVFGTTCEPPSLTEDRATLELLYGATRGSGWVNNANWLTDAPLGEWYGVETDDAGRVTRLALAQNGLAGVIPPELGRLANLRDLDLRDNGLTGPISPELGELTELRILSVNSNYLDGSIPPELGGLAHLEVLNLRRNQLTGPIPAELGNLKNAWVLGLLGNQLSGSIPPELGNLVNLGGLLLSENQLTGPIPPELGNLVNLVGLSLSENQLTGPIPPELGRLANLRHLDLRYNGLTGPIPPELGNLTGLERLHLSGNRLSGPIPPELGKLGSVQSIWLSHNMLSGFVPSEMGNLGNLIDMHLTGNELTGPLPRSFLGLEKLVDLTFEYGASKNHGLCVPATDEFREWARQVTARGNVDRAPSPFCDEVDRRVLETLYQATNGSGWTQSAGWLEDKDLSRWHGVRTDPFGRVGGLDLADNGLSGRLPGTLGRLAGLTELRIGNNALGGRMPLSLANLPLEEFEYGGTSLCASDDAEFRAWLNGIPDHIGTGVQCPPLTDREILELLYLNTDGPNWKESAGWLTDVPLAQWHGVGTDDAGRVVGLGLWNNGLSGSIPVELGQLSQLRDLHLGGNRLSGAIPPETGDLDRLEGLYLGGNQLGGTIPASLGQLSQLRGLHLGGNRLSGAIPPELGGLGHLGYLGLERNQLSGEIPKQIGGLANLRTLALGRNHLNGAIPPELGGLGHLERLDLERNQLSGAIPKQIGGLANLAWLSLADNQLSGPIPPELGALAHLEHLLVVGNQLSGKIPAELGNLDALEYMWLAENQLTGAIPSQLGGLANLLELNLTDNELSGPIPAELGDLAKLTGLDLGGNELSGPLPAELGRAASLERLDLRSNALSGPVPPDFGNLGRLKSFILARNPALAGPLPPALAVLDQLELFMAGDTGLCRPADARFDAWFGTIRERRIVRCQGGAAVYLTQTVQSWDDPVPLIAGESALLRVFVTAPQGTATMPDIRATFYADGAERYSVLIPASTQAIPSEVIEGDLAGSANAEIPEWVVVPGLEMVIEVDPDGTLNSSLGVTKRIPDSGRMAVEVRRVPPFHLTLVPFLWETEPDLSVVESVSGMVEDPSGHELLRDMRTLLPVGELVVAAREPVITSTKNPRKMLAQVDAMRLLEGAAGHWMGIFGESEPSTISWPVGVARRGGHVSVSEPLAGTIAHELGHNLGLMHAPCACGDTDPWFPHPGGRIGAWGYDLGHRALVHPGAADVMSYCRGGAYWISDFFFNKALNHRLANDDAAATALAAEADPTRAILVWGGRDQDGVPYLDPAFVVEASPSVPASGGQYTIRGAAADGVPIFSFTFDMPVTEDAAGEETSFVFALPLQTGWAGNLVSITLSGPGGSATLDESTDRPMAILRDPKTRQVRGFLSDLPAGESAQAAAKRAMVADSELEVLFSRGIPDLR